MKRALAIAALIVGVLVLGGLRYRFLRARDMSSGSQCVVTLRVVDGCKHEWALEHSQPLSATPTWDDLRPYLPRDWTNGNAHGGVPSCPKGGRYTLGPVSDPPTCSIGGLGHSLPEALMKPSQKRPGQ